MNLAALRRHRLLFLLCLFGVPFVAVGLSLIKEKQYTSTSTLLFRKANFDAIISPGLQTFQTTADADRQSATDIGLVTLGAVADRTARTLGGTVTPAYARAHVHAIPSGRSNLVSISATTPSPELSQKLAQTFAEQYISFRRDADRRKLREATQLVAAKVANLTPEEAKTTSGQELTKRADQLQTLTSLQTGNAEIVQSASVPSVPSSPRPKRNAVTGLVLGLLLGLVAVYLRERSDRSVKDTDEIEKILGRPILGSIPKVSRSEELKPGSLSAGVAEAFQLLRTNLRYFNLKTDVRLLLVTSARPGEGKSTVASDLATAAARSGMKTILLEADLRQPGLTQRLELPASVGLSDVAAGLASVDDAIMRLPLDVPGREGATLDIVPAGPLPPNPGELLESERMQALLATLRERYELVIIDSPPIAILGDAIPLVEHVDGVLVVTRIEYSQRDDLVRLREQLDNLGAHFLGVVANGVRTQALEYGYYAAAANEAASRRPTRPGADDDEPTAVAASR